MRVVLQAVKMGFEPNRDWDRMDREQLRRMQLRKLRRFLAHHVLPFSPFYRETLKRFGLRPESLRSFADLARIPFTTKKDIVPSDENPEGPKSFILQPTPELIKNELPLSALVPIALRKAFRGEAALKRALLEEYGPVKMLFTTGRSASPLPFFLTRYDLEVLRETGRRIVDVLGLTPENDRTVSLFPYAPHLAFWQVAACAEAAGIMTLNTGGGRVMGSDRILDIVERMKPTTVCGMPGYFYHLLRQAREEGRELSFIRTIALGGEKVSRVLKGRIVEILESMGAENPKVASVYGFTEARQCWAECTGAADTGFHVSPDLCIVEIVDPQTGEQLDDGETGELVYTTLDGRGSAVLRYRTGDVIEGGITHEACPGCGRTLPRVSSLIARVSNVKELDVSKVKGTWVNFNTLTEILEEEAAIEEWQIVIDKPGDDPLEMDRLTLLCAVTPGTEVGSFKERVQQRVATSSEVHFNDVVILDLDEMLEHVGMEVNTKEVRVVDRRPSTNAKAETNTR